MRLLDLVENLEAYLESSTPGDHTEFQLSNVVGIQAYTFEEVTLEYGPGRKQTVRVRHDAAKNRFRLSFGGHQDLAGMCPHIVVKDQLEDHLNSNRNLALLAKILHETYTPLRSVCRLPNTPQMGVSMHKTNQAFKTFITVPQSPTHLKASVWKCPSLAVPYIISYHLNTFTGHLLQHLRPGCPN